jgi:hypothetical protein
MYNIPTGPSDYPTPGSDAGGGGGGGGSSGSAGNNNEAKTGRPSPFMVSIMSSAPFGLADWIAKSFSFNVIMLNLGVYCCFCLYKLALLWWGNSILSCFLYG